MDQNQSPSATASVNEEPSNPSFEVREEAVQTQTARTSRILYRSLLLMLFGTEALILMWLLPHDKVTLHRHRSLLPLRSSSASSASQDPYLEAMKNAPKIGTPFLPTGIGKIVRQVAPKHVRYTLLGYVGNCASCLNVNLKSWQEEAKARGVGFVLFTTAPSFIAQTFVKQQGLKVPIVCDIKGDLVKQLKALWPGRCFLIGAGMWRGSIVLLGRSTTPLETPHSKPF
ncbi:Redoxin [Chthonomonas calidirosea]|uniref:Redoxin n=1 Tax=Chthonomonas calidirosea (strain DSM 23976 / ICMP 18418 / T49) TaxID=1303518 RepID=S0EWQ5_CHTCT|nr:redoxin [Chthonomonas calidirosea]CCW36349.1 Redoxin [Chthonomonas calidirosea T49]CEK17597.1 Redoxin [Chthonomonas calidirosea]